MSLPFAKPVIASTHANDATAHAAACVIRNPLSACLLVLLSACGSTPEAPMANEGGAVEPRPAVEEQAASAANTASSQTRVPTAAPRTSAPQSAEGTTEPPPPAEAMTRFDAAVVHMSAGDTAAAEQSFRELAAAYPTFSGPLLNLGILQAKAGKFAQAEASVLEAIKRNPTNAAAFNQLGIVQRKLGRFKEAEQSYQRAIEIDPSYALAHLNLGVLCDLYLQQPERALQAYERYLELAASPDAKVTSWVNELRKRVGAEPSAARSDE